MASKDVSPQSPRLPLLQDSRVTMYERKFIASVWLYLTLLFYNSLGFQSKTFKKTDPVRLKDKIQLNFVNRMWISAVAELREMSQKGTSSKYWTRKARNDYKKWRMTALHTSNKKSFFSLRSHLRLTLSWKRWSGSRCDSSLYSRGLTVTRKIPP